MQMPINNLLSSLAIVFFVSACASVPMGSPTEDAKLKQFKTLDDKAAVYIYRHETKGGAILLDVELDGNPIGKTAAQTYLYQELTPGRHKVVSRAENTDTLEFEAVPGKLYFVWQEVKINMTAAHNKLHLVSNKEGQEGVKACALAISQ